MPDRLRVAVAGSGIGQAQLSAYQRLPEQFELVALCDIDQASARQLPRVSN